MASTVYHLPIRISATSGPDQIANRLPWRQHILTYINGNPYMVRNVILADIDYKITRVYDSIGSSVGVLVLVKQIKAGVGT